MILTPHTVTGLLLAKIFPNSLISAPLALISHYILDIIPHEQKDDIKYPIPERNQKSIFDKDSKRRFIIVSVTDSIISCLILFYFFINQKIIEPAIIFNYLIVIFFSIFPDILNIIGMYFPFRIMHLPARLHHKIHLVFKIYMNRYLSIALQYIISFLIYFLIVL